MKWGGGVQLLQGKQIDKEGGLPVLQVKPIKGEEEFQYFKES